MVAVIWKHSNAFEKNSAMVKLAKVTVSEQHAISNRRAVTYWGTAPCMGNHTEKNERHISSLLLKLSDLFQQCPQTQSILSPQRSNACRLLLPLEHQIRGLEVVSRHLHTKSYLTPSPLARTVGKMQCAISILIAFTSRITTVPLV